MERARSQKVQPNLGDLRLLRKKLRATGPKLTQSEHGPLLVGFVATSRRSSHAQEQGTTSHWNKNPKACVEKSLKMYNFGLRFSSLEQGIISPELKFNSAELRHSWRCGCRHDTIHQSLAYHSPASTRAIFHLLLDTLTGSIFCLRLAD